MNNKFVFESFKLYLDMVDVQINEAKGDFEPTGHHEQNIYGIKS